MQATAWEKERVSLFLDSWWRYLLPPHGRNGAWNPHISSVAWMLAKVVLLISAATGNI